MRRASYHVYAHRRKTTCDAGCAHAQRLQLRVFVSSGRSCLVLCGNATLVSAGRATLSLCGNATLVSAGCCHFCQLIASPSLAAAEACLRSRSYNPSGKGESACWQGSLRPFGPEWVDCALGGKRPMYPLHVSCFVVVCFLERKGIGSTLFMLEGGLVLAGSDTSRLSAASYSSTFCICGMVLSSFCGMSPLSFCLRALCGMVPSILSLRLIVCCSRFGQLRRSPNRVAPIFLHAVA